MTTKAELLTRFETLVHEAAQELVTHPVIVRKGLQGRVNEVAGNMLLHANRFADPFDCLPTNWSAKQAMTDASWRDRIAGKIYTTTNMGGYR